MLNEIKRRRQIETCNATKTQKNALAKLHDFNLVVKFQSKNPCDHPAGRPPMVYQALPDEEYAEMDIRSSFQLPTVKPKGPDLTYKLVKIL